MARELHSVANAGDAEDSAALRDLVGEEFRLAEPLLPERAEATVRRTADRVFIDTDGGGEEARDEIEPRFIRATRYGDATRHDLSQSSEVGLQAFDLLFVGHFDQIVEPIAMNRERFDSETFDQMRGSRCG